MDTRKVSKTVQEMVPDARQHFLPVGRLRKKAGNCRRSSHRAENDEEISLPLWCGRTRHELHPPFRAVFHHAHRQARSLHRSGNTRAVQSFGAKLVGGVPHDAFAGLGLVFRFITHGTSPLDYTSNPWMHDTSVDGSALRSAVAEEA